MPFNPAHILAAQAVQHAAAHDSLPQVRIIAGPGTGKSSAIEERVRWLLAQNVAPATIYAVSFTRASSLDLKQRVQSHCERHGLPSVAQVRVSTLHALALRVLRTAGLLTAYPSDPLVLDPWEVESIFDAEFGDVTGIGKERREKIRYEHEAFWSTGVWQPPNYAPPSPPITAAERSRFVQFHMPRTQTYSCVLPGEIVRQCVTHMAAGTLNAVGLLNIGHLVVDEFQDLNPMDIEFVDHIVAQGARICVAGDDDQSIYSFRFGSPIGIQRFVTTYPAAGQHALGSCFRCTPSVLAAADALITAYPQQNRIPKNQVSLYATAVPPCTGIVHRWRFSNGVAEARGVAASCRDLIAAGTNPRDIVVLVSNRRALLRGIESAFQGVGVAYEPPRAEGFLDSKAGRVVLAAIRVVCEPDDYVAHRCLLGLRRGVGIGTCTAVTESVLLQNLNYRSLFYDPLPAGVFTGRRLTALKHARTLCAQLRTWQASETLAQRMAEIGAVLGSVLSPADNQLWLTYASTLPPEMTLEELRDFLWADTDEQQMMLLQAVFARLGAAIPAGGLLPARVRVMTMHGVKGLSGKIVFVPGLEEEILPGHLRQPFPGLVLEAARLLYVSITRARAACIVSLADTRIVNGRFNRQTPSRFTTALGGRFVPKASGLTAPEVAAIMHEVANL